MNDQPELTIQSHDVPWPKKANDTLVAHSILTLDQVYRIGQLEGGVRRLADLTSCSEEQWRNWLEDIAATLPEESRQMPPEIDKNALLTKEMAEWDDDASPDK